jgi:uncharacterized membrane protein
MIEVRSDVTIRRPADEVFAFVADAENNPRWQQGMRSCRWTSDGPIGIGSTYEQRASFLGRDIESTFVVDAFEPGRSITIRTTESTFPITVTRAVEPLPDGGCLVRAHVQGDASGVFRLAAPVMRWMVGRSVRADYRRLRTLLEGGNVTR